MIGKICKKCGDLKELGCFSKRRASLDGFQVYCKDCDTERHRSWCHDNKPKIIASNRRYVNKKLKSDPIFKMKLRVRSLLRKSLASKGFAKKGKTFDIVGLGGEALHEHLLEGFFKVYGRYSNEFDQLDIDHIIPLVTAKTEEEVLRLNHYTNLRYLLREHNQKDRAKLEWNYVRTTQD